MRRRNRALAALLLCGAAGGAVAFWPALAQKQLAQSQKAPESLLPPGFGEPAQQPPPPPQQPSEPGAPAAQPRPGAPAELLPPLALTPPEEANAPPDAATAAQDEQKAANLEMPPSARRSLAAVGVIEPPYGFAADAFGRARGPFLTTLMRRLDAPVASRWESILLRRALLSRVPAPRGVAPVDWVAERAWLLLRMGEADAARMLVQGVDVADFDPRMYQVATQTALATADPAGLCPLVPGASAFSKEPVWPLAAAMCAALSGEAGMSGMLMDRARGQRVARGVDLLLAEKVAGAGIGGRRAINIEWSDVDRLTAWRFGLSAALAVKIPDALFNSVGPQVQAWRARAPEYAPLDRAASARVAAALGVFSNAALVDLYGQIADATDPAEITDSDAGRLRTAYVGEDDATRMTAMRALWDKAEGERDRYGAAILTARAAARITPDPGLSGDAASLIGSMMSAGLDMQAARWARIVEGMNAGKADKAWAMLAVGTPEPSVDLSFGRIDGFRSRSGDEGLQKSRLLIAALAGLGRVPARDQARLASAAGLPLDAQDRWTRAIDRAAREGEAGTVALLCAVAMQTPGWGGVPAQHFYHMIAALRAVGYEPEARMMAAEAMTRL